MGGTYYVFGSHLTGWSLNDNIYATATSLGGPWSSFRDFAAPGTHTYGKFGTYTGLVDVFFTGRLLGSGNFTATVAPDLTVYNTLDIDETTLG